MLHSLLKKIMAKQRIHEFVFINEHPSVLNNCIYVSNHSCKWDFQYLVEAMDKHFIVLAGTQRMTFIDRFGVIWNGVVWVDRKNKKSKNSSKARLMKLLRKGKSLLIFPEGTWNLEPSTIMLPLHWGVIEMAQQTGVPIVPVVLEYRNSKCFVKFGTPVNIDSCADKSVSIVQLRDNMATLRWNIWEQFPVEKRSDIPEDYWSMEVKRRLDEYVLLDYEYEMSCVREK